MDEEITVKIQKNDIPEKIDGEAGETTIRTSKHLQNGYKSTIDMIEDYQEIGERREVGIRRMYAKLQETQKLQNSPIIKKHQKDGETLVETAERLAKTADNFIGS